jgi:Flp pilus assembly pilin Flp
MTKLYTKASTALQSFKKDESGATLVEYSVAVGIVIIVGAAIFATIGTNMNTIFTAVNGVLATAAAG